MVDSPRCFRHGKVGHSSPRNLETRDFFAQGIRITSPSSTSEGSLSLHATSADSSKCFTPEQPSDVIQGIVMLEPSEVISELFAHIGAGLHLRDLAGIVRTSQLFAERVREQFARRDDDARKLSAWSNDPHWDLCLARLCGLEPWPGRWKVLPPAIYGRVGAVCALIANFIYLIGGSRHGKPTNAAERLNLERGTWEELPPLLGKRCVDRNTAVAVIRGKLYLFGGLGFDQRSPSNCVDCFDPDQGQWSSLPAMPTPRYGATAAVMSGRVFICGGSAGVGTSFIPVLCFDPGALHWECLPPMLGNCHRGEAVVANGTIYVGTRDHRPIPLVSFDDATHGAPFSLAQGERFHTVTRTWSRCMNAMFSSTGSSIALALNSSLYLCEPPYNGGSISERSVRVAGTERCGNSDQDASLATGPTAQLGIWPYHASA